MVKLTTLGGLMLKGYKYRIYPTASQRLLLDKHFGACRFIYNLGLETKNYAYLAARKNIGYAELCRQLPGLKNDCPWLKEVDSQALQQVLMNLDKAFAGFFKGHTKFPKFKKKINHQSFRSPHVDTVFIDTVAHTIRPPKFKTPIKVVFDRLYNGKVRSSTFSKTPTGKYFVSILVETGTSIPTKPLITPSTSIGIDLGIKHYIVTSNGLKIENKKFLNKSLGRLRVLNKKVSRKKRGSANRKKAARRVALCYEKISNQRKDFLHKLSNRVLNNHDTICLENLMVVNMIRNRRLSKAISDAGWSTFVDILEYKALWYGKNILKIGRFEPSSKMCNKCSYINLNLTLSIREWGCINCGASHDRDINAAINIKNIALKNSGGVPPGEPVELLALAGAVKQEYAKA